MRNQRRRSRILQFGGRDVAGCQTSGLRQFKNSLVILLMNINAQRAVIGLHAGAPGRGRRRRVRHVVRLTGFFVQGIMRVLTGERQRVNTFKITARAFGIVTCGGNFRIPHPIANQQNDIFGLLII